MNILWITNMPFGYHNVMLHQESSPVISGSWLYAAYEGAKQDINTTLHIVTVSNVSKRIDGEHEGNYFHILPGGVMGNYDMFSKDNIESWQMLRNDISPDIVVLWGAEAKFSYTAAKVFSDLPLLVFVQGVLKSIVSHYNDGVPHRYICTTIRDYINKVLRIGAEYIYQKQLPFEVEIYNMASGAIVENDWCEYQCKSMNPKIRIFRNELPIREPYYEYTWDANNKENHTIFTNAGGSPIKGHHILFKALSIVKRTYPNVKLYIPGINYMQFSNSVKQRTGYISYLNKIYKDNNLSENIIFTGTLTPQQMAERIAKSHIYVMPSTAENHSSSLIEALLVGTPCISSLVGGTASLVRNKENGILYNSLEADTLAGSIMELFENDDLCQSLSSAAITLRAKRDRHFGEKMSAIYYNIMNNYV